MLKSGGPTVTVLRPTREGSSEVRIGWFLEGRFEVAYVPNEALEKGVAPK